MSASIFSCFTAISVFAHSSGKAGSTAGCTCHGAAPNPSLSIKVTSASGSFSVEPGGVLNLRAVVAHTSNNFFGIDIAVKSTANSTGASGQGVLSPSASETDLRLSKGELTHNLPRKGTNDSVEFNFSWQAPAASGVYFLHIAALAANNDGLNNTLDQWNIIEPIRLDVGSTAVEETISYSTDAAVPNPSHESVSIKFQLDVADYCQILIADMHGNITFASSGQYRTDGEQVFDWDGRDSDGITAPSGRYMALIRVRNKTLHIPIVIKR